jgi:hypothetical protein
MSVCEHEQLDFAINVTAFEDRPGRALDISGKCKACGAPIGFVGLPMGISMNRPTVSIDGHELRLPVTIGDEPHVPGVEMLGRWSHGAKA